MVPEQATSRGDPIIRVEDFKAAYGGRVVLHDVNFEIYPGEVVVICGGSGCGKSTVLKHIIGLYEPAGGRILIDGDDIHEVQGADRDRLLRKFGVAYQGGALFGSMTVLENVRVPLEEFTDLSEDMMNLIGLAKLRLVGLEQAAQRMPSELSGGMQKRAALARAIALDPRIVFLDEPSAGLDPIMSADLDQLILTLKRLLHMTFVMVTHELPSIFTVADRVVMLDAATRTCIAVDAPAYLRDSSPDPAVRAFFNRQATETSPPASQAAEQSSEPEGSGPERGEG